MKLNSLIKIHHFTAGVGWLSRISSATMQLFFVRVVMQSIGVDSYAVLATFIGLVGWLQIFEFGIGSSLQNRISQLRVLNISYRNLIVSTIALITVVLLAMTGIVYLLRRVLVGLIVPSQGGVPFGMAELLVFVFSALSLISVYGLVGGKILFAEKKGYLVHIFNFTNIAFSLILSWIFLPKVDEQWRLLVSTLFYFGPIAIQSLCLMIYTIYKCRGHFLPLKIDKGILKTAFNFWGFSLFSLLVLQVDYLFLARYGSSLEIVVYNTLLKLFSFSYFFFFAILQALWPEFTEAFEKKNFDWIKQEARRVILIGIGGMVLFTLTVAIYSDRILKLLTNNSDVKASLGLISLMGFYFILRVWTDTFAVILQSRNQLRALWISVPIQAVIGIIAQFLLVPRYGAIGVTLSLCIAFLSSVFWMLPIFLRQEYMKVKSGTI